MLSPKPYVYNFSQLYINFRKRREIYMTKDEEENYILIQLLNSVSCDIWFSKKCCGRHLKNSMHHIALPQFQKKTNSIHHHSLYMQCDMFVNNALRLMIYS